MLHCHNGVNLLLLYYLLSLFSHYKLFVSFGGSGFSAFALCILLIAVASLVAEHGLQVRELRSCGARA